MPSRSEETSRLPQKLQFAVLGSYSDHAASIAEIIASWNILEQSTFLLLAVLLRTNPEHTLALLTAIASSQARIDVISAVGNIELKDNRPLLEEFRSIMKSLSKRLQARNEYAHGVYVTNAKNQLCILHRQFEIPPKPAHMRVLYPHALLEEHRRGIEVSRKLKVFRRKLWNRLPHQTRQSLLKIWSQQETLDLPSTE